MFDDNDDDYEIKYGADAVLNQKHLDGINHAHEIDDDPNVTDAQRDANLKQAVDQTQADADQAHAAVRAAVGTPQEEELEQQAEEKQALANGVREFYETPNSLH